MQTQNFQINNRFLKNICLLATLTFLFSSCRKDAIQTLPERSWELVWSDEFTGAANTSPDNTKWNFNIGNGVGGWGNGEYQFYTNRTNNVRLDGNGVLEITARQEAFSGSNYTSGRITTQGKFAHKYGRFEARIKTPTGPGVWPAFWMMGENITSVSWPQCGEIDVLEQKGQESHITYATIHGPGYAGGNSIGKSYALAKGRFNLDYYTYAVEWSENQIDFFANDFLFHRITKDQVQAKGEWVFNQPFFLLLNVAVGGNYVGFPTSGTPFPQTMFVDYIRVYKQK